MRSAPHSPAHALESGIGFKKKHCPRTGHNLHGCASGRQTDGIGRTWPWAVILPPRTEAHRRAAKGQTGYLHRDPIVPGS